MKAEGATVAISLPAKMWASLLGVWQQARPYQRLGYLVGGTLILVGLTHLAAWLLVGGPWQCPVSFRKPTTFGISLGLTRCRAPGDQRRGSRQPAMTPTIQAVGPRKRFGKTTGAGRAPPGPLWGQVLAVPGATANQRSREHPRRPRPKCRPCAAAGRDHHSVERQGG